MLTALYIAVLRVTTDPFVSAAHDRWGVDDSMHPPTKYWVSHTL